MTEETAGATVLVIDDEPAVRRLLRALLEMDGYTVYEAMTGPIGLGLIPIVLPEVVLLDVMMPGMDGLEACAQIVADYPDLPIVILTARDDNDLERRCLAAGAARFLTKPLLSGQLTEVVESLAVPHRASRPRALIPKSPTSLAASLPPEGLTI
ncbi:MAG: response regulator transcription factor [Acidimicrobiales bacterium]